MNKNSAPSTTRRKRPLTVKAELQYKTIYINKCKLTLPVEIDLYPTQKLMINRILKALNEKENALVEAPTGSGKTLALLSSTCSWLLDYGNRRKEKRRLCAVHGDEVPVTLEPWNISNFPMKEEQDSLEYMSTDEIFNDTVKMEVSTQGDSDWPQTSQSKPPAECTCLPKMRIYYCTRTHKQISQVIKEYKRLPYWRNTFLRHTILASREQTCVNQDIRQMDGDLNTNCKKALEPNNQGCVHRDLLKGVGSKDRFALRNALQEKHLEVWDIEELSKALKLRLDVCPYFLTNRELTKDANIIFAPFNYLVDPIIRESSDVILKNSIVILDEAHNIEDVCRNSASFDFSDSELTFSLYNIKSKQDEVRKHLNGPKILKHQVDDQRDYSKDEVLHEYLENLDKWYAYLNEFFALFADLVLDVENLEPNRHTQARTKGFEWENLNTLLTSIYLQFDSEDYRGFNSAFNKLAGKNELPDRNGTDTISDLNLRLNHSSIVCMEKLLFFFKFYSQKDNRKFYKGNIEILPKKVQTNTSMSIEQELPKDLIPGYVINFSFWAMMPSMAFGEAFAQTHSIILASGTLCPLQTFCGELGVEFKSQMEGEQIIDKERIFAAAISKSPGGSLMRLTFTNMNKNMMAELAHIVFKVCEIVPKGVLVFLSSYRVLQDLKTAFFDAKLMRKLNLIKEVFYEPKNSTEMNNILVEYEAAIKYSKGKRNGAVMFAVFRGKVSEGLDFSDNKARAVVTIGIPFPNFADQQVQLKRNFNDANAVSCNLLTGSEWYETQAYRAINQALGRCLRHRNDWGALIMLDERYTPKQTKISSWIRKQMKVLAYQDFCNSLKEFVDFHLGQSLIELDDTSNLEADDDELDLETPSRKDRNSFFRGRAQ